MLITVEDKVIRVKRNIPFNVILLDNHERLRIRVFLLDIHELIGFKSYKIIHFLYGSLLRPSFDVGRGMGLERDIDMVYRDKSITNSVHSISLGIWSTNH